MNPSVTHQCQSCGMPMPEEHLRGTESSGAKSADYCVYCYEDGSFKQPDCSLEQMIEICVPHLTKSGMPEVQARQLLSGNLPALKRWSKGV